MEIHNLRLWTPLAQRRKGRMKAEYITHMGDDLMVANAARVSHFNHKEEFDEKDEKLIGYLERHQHWTPFAHPQITLRMTAPIPIRTQCFKHKVGFVENEVSRRYVKFTPSFYRPRWRQAHKNVKQGSGEEFSQPESLQFRSMYEQVIHHCIDSYERMIENGVCPEQARFILPQGMETTWYWTGSLAAFARFCVQRGDSHAQKEINELSQMVSEIISELFPVSWKALMSALKEEE